MLACILIVYLWLRAAPAPPGFQSVAASVCDAARRWYRHRRYPLTRCHSAHRPSPSTKAVSPPAPCSPSVTASLDSSAKAAWARFYRAGDLKLGQPVALKFLPAATAKNQQLLARFHAEVRIAHQVSHPNVCRVYDIGEIDGFTFLSMEYVDGENLRSLLRRIGRLPGDKAIEIARKLCAGLAAAHDKGVLHRDLKPANVMIDGRGQWSSPISVSPPSPDNSTEPTSATARAPTWPLNSSLEKTSPSESDIYALGFGDDSARLAEPEPRPRRSARSRRLGAFYAALPMLSWLFNPHHDETAAELFFETLDMIGSSLFLGALTAAAYIALEPHVRRRWPQKLGYLGPPPERTNSQSPGRKPSPYRHRTVNRRRSLQCGVIPLRRPAHFPWGAIHGDLRHAESFVYSIRLGIAVALGLFFLFFLLRVLLRQEWLAAGAVILVAQFLPIGIETVLERIAFTLMVGVFLLVIIRFGVLATAAGFFAVNLLSGILLATDFSAWYAGSTILVVSVFLAFTAHAFHTAVANRKLFKADFLAP